VRWSININDLLLFWLFFWLEIDWKLVRLGSEWSDRKPVGQIPTIWVGLCSRISDQILIRIWVVPTDSAWKTWGTDKTSMDITSSSPRISPWQFLALRFLHRLQWHAQLLHFYPSGSIVSDWASFLIGSLDARLLILTYGANYPLWSASIIWQHRLCFYYKLCVLDIIIMRHHATFPFWRLYWCAWHVASIMLIGFSSISPRYA